MYGILAWGNASQAALNQSTRLQKRAIRIVNKASYRCHTEPLFKSSNVLTINDLYEQQVALFMFDFLHGRLPLSFDNMFKFNHDINPRYMTRQCNQLYIPRARLSFTSKLPSSHFPRIWNKWSNLLQPNMSKNTFRNRIKQQMLSSYANRIKCSSANCQDCK